MQDREGRVLSASSNPGWKSVLLTSRSLLIRRGEKMTDLKTRNVAGAAAGAALSAMLLAPALAAAAQSYPERPVRIVVNVTAGGGVDTTARVVAQHLYSVFGQPFIIDNRTGAGGSIGIELVAKAAPDGHTLLICSSASSPTPLIVRRIMTPSAIFSR